MGRRSCWFSFFSPFTECIGFIFRAFYGDVFEIHHRRGIMRQLAVSFKEFRAKNRSGVVMVRKESGRRRGIGRVRRGTG